MNFILQINMEWEMKMRFRNLIVFFMVLMFVGMVIGQTSELEELDVEGSDVKASNVKHYSDTNIIVFQENGRLELDVDGDKRIYENIKKDGKMIIENGEITRADFEISKTGKYKFGNKEFELPEGTIVLIADKVVEFNVPKDTKIEMPEGISKGADDLDYSYVTQGGSLELPNGEIIEGSEVTKIGYEGGDGGGFHTSENLAIKNSEGVKEFDLNVNKKTYFALDKFGLIGGREEVFIGEERLVLNSPSEGGVVSFNEGNRYRIEVDEGHSVSVQAVNGKVIVDSSDIERIPNIQFSGNSKVDLDKRGFYGKNDKLYVDSKKGLISGVEHSDNDAPVQLTLIKDNGERLLGYDLLSNGKDQYVSVSKKDLDGPSEVYKSKDGFYVASKIAFNELTPEAKKFYVGLEARKQKEINAEVNRLGGDAGNVLIQRVMKNYQAAERRRLQNPLMASVRIRAAVGRQPVGGSGVIVGTTKDGYPIVYTAAHVLTAGEKGRKITRGMKVDVELPRQYPYPGGGTIRSGRVIDAKLRGSGEDGDVAIIQLEDKIPNIPYIPIASESQVLKKGDIVQRIGCPNCGPFQKSNVRITAVSSAEGQIETKGRVIQGESGGPLIKNGRVFGVTSIGFNFVDKITREKSDFSGGYTSTSELRDIAKRNNLGHLIKIIYVFFE
jgi:hypothetical protein